MTDPIPPNTPAEAQSGWHLQLFATTVGAGIRWRLLSGNNRDMGRGTARHRNPGAARAELQAIQATPELLSSRVRRDSPTAWAWELIWDGTLVAVTSRPFDRSIRCEQGARNAIAYIATAPIDDGLMLSSARRGRSSPETLFVPSSAEMRRWDAYTLSAEPELVRSRRDRTSTEPGRPGVAADRPRLDGCGARRVEPRGTRR